MRLKRLEIYGFKSFADRTVIEFDQGITGIVGPNGSGKSNLSDAVRWVLGETSAKSLRGGKMEDVIFNGTDRRKRMGYGEVSLVFDNEDHTLQVDYNEVMITRRVYRSGEGEYYINKATCRLKDIIDLFRDTGIGRDGYSIIGQGRIDEILSQKSEDRRGVFEEAAGITKFRSRKEESEKRLSNMRDNLTRVEDIIAELESQLEPLEKASETARRYLSLRDELRGLECSSYVVHVDRNGVRIEEGKQLIEDLAHQIEQAEAQATEKSAERDSAAERVSELDSEVTAAHGNVLALTREREARDGELSVLKAEIARCEKDVLTSNDDILKRKNRDTDIRSSLKENHEASEKNLLRVKEAEEGLLNTERSEAAAESAAAEAEEILEAHKAKIIEMMNRLSDVRTNEARLSTMKDELLRRRKEAEVEKEVLTRDADSLGEQKNEAGAELADARDAVKEKEKAVAAIEAEARESQEKIRALQQKAEELGSQATACDSRLRVLQEMERDYAGYQQAVKEALKHAVGNPKVHGVVANLMQVPRDYEKAVEAVLGGALQNIVTDDEYVARDLINYLRSGKLGRATFLPISTIRGRTLNAQERQVLSMPGCRGLASELISFDSRYRDIMENLLGRTVIAENLDAGIEIMRRGRHAFRLVTLDGDVMHSGGSMTGGSAASRMTSLLSRDREIHEHQERLNRLKSDIQKARDLRSREEENRAVIRRRREACYEDLNQARIDESICEERLRILTDKETAQTERESQNALLLSQIDSNLREVETQLAGTQASQEGDTQSTEEMNRQTQIYSDDLYNKRKQRDTLRDEIAEKRLALQAMRSEGENLSRDAKRLLQEQENIAREIDALEENVRNLTLTHQRSMEQLQKQTREREEVAGQLVEAEKALTDLQQERGQVQENMSRMTREIDALRESVNVAGEKKHRTELTVNRLENELETQRQRIWEEYELTYAGAKEYLLDPFDLVKADRRIVEIRTEIRALGPVNVTAVEDYRNTKDRYDGLTTQRNDLLKAEDDLTEIISSLEKQMQVQFMANFTLLQTYLSETFTRLFDGGKAELRLQDPSDPLNCGIDIVAQPPGKKLQMLTLLSGGERALTAIAILFAMLRLKPTPFCFLDEIEAALDDGNISTFAEYLKDFSKDTQFVIVSHRKGTMERCDCLYGVAMEEKGVSKILSVELKDISDDALAG